MRRYLLPRYEDGVVPGQQQLSNALNNFGYRLLSFLPYTRQFVNVFDILGMSPDSKQGQIENLTDGSGLVAGTLNEKTKPKPSGPGTIRQRFAEAKAKAWKKALRPLRAIDVAGDLIQLYDDYRVLNDAAKKTRGVYNSGIIIDPNEYH